MLPRRAVKREGALLQFPVSGLRPGRPARTKMTCLFRGLSRRNVLQNPYPERAALEWFGAN